MAVNWANGIQGTKALEAWACNCIGPQNGEPRCPCMMRGVIQRDGRWVEMERDLGPVLPTFTDKGAS